MKLSIARSWKRQVEMSRFRSSNPFAGMSRGQLRDRAIELRAVPASGVHCTYCGASKPSIGAPCPNDNEAWPHPRSAA